MYPVAESMDRRGGAVLEALAGRAPPALERYARAAAGFAEKAAQ